jgi:hypothetical protein
MGLCRRKAALGTKTEKPACSIDNIRLLGPERCNWPSRAKTENIYVADQWTVVVNGRKPD